MAISQYSVAPRAVRARSAAHFRALFLGAAFVGTALELAAQKPVQQQTPQEKAAAIIEFGQQYSKGARQAAVQQLRDALNTYLKMPKSGPFRNVLAKDPVDDLDISVADVKAHFINNLRMGLINDGTPNSVEKMNRATKEATDAVAREWPGVVAEAKKDIATELPKEVLDILSFEHARPTPPRPQRRK